MKAAWPSESCPAQPPMRSQAVARAAKSTTLMPKLSERGRIKGYAAPAASTAAIAPRVPRPPRRVLYTRPPEEPGGAHEEDEEEGDEAEGIARSGCAERRCDRLDDAEEEPAPDGADDAAHAAEHGDHERLEREDAADGGEDVERGQEQDARGHGEHGADAEDGGADETGVDALQLGGVAVLRAGANGAAEVGAGEHEVERRDDQHGERKGDEQREREGDGEDAHRPRRVRGVDGLRVRAEDEQKDIAEDEADADRHQNRRVLGGVLDGREQEPLDGRTEKQAGGRDAKERDVRVEARRAEEDEGEVHPYSHALAVGEVDDAHDAEDEAQADALHLVVAAGEHAGGDRLDEGERGQRLSQGGVG